MIFHHAKRCYVRNPESRAVKFIVWYVLVSLVGLFAWKGRGL